MNHEERQHTGKEQIHEQSDVVERGIQLAIARIGVRLVFDEACIGTGVAFSAGSDEIGFIDWAARIGRGKNIVGAVAVPTACGLNVSAERAELGVERIAVGGELVGMATAANRRGTHAEGVGRGLLDGVRGVAVGADGRLHIPGCNGLAVNTAKVVLGDAGVAFAARCGNVGLVGRALGILAAEDFMRPVAALAVGGNQQAFLAEREPVNGVDVGGINAVESMLLGHAVGTVAGTACFRNIQRIDGGTGV